MIVLISLSYPFIFIMTNLFFDLRLTLVEILAPIQANYTELQLDHSLVATRCQCCHRGLLSPKSPTVATRHLNNVFRLIYLNLINYITKQANRFSALQRLLSPTSPIVAIRHQTFPADANRNRSMVKRSHQSPTEAEKLHPNSSSTLELVLPLAAAHCHHLKLVL